jgi:hypothetical protein
MKMRLRVFKDGGYGKFRLSHPWYIRDLNSDRVARCTADDDGASIDVSQSACGFVYFKYKKDAVAHIHRCTGKPYVVR